MFTSSKTYLLALAAMPYLLLNAEAAPAKLEARMEPDGTLFPEGGLELSHIAIKKSDSNPRSEEANIFSQGLIVTRKLNKGWLPLLFEDYDGQSKVLSDDMSMKPFYMGYKVAIEPEVIPIARNQALMDADLSGVDDMTFGESDPTPWWPYAVLSCITKAGWGKTGTGPAKGRDLVVQTLELLTGFKAMGWSPIGQPYKEQLSIADETPIIIQLKPFDLVKHEYLKDLRWERWVTVMSYDKDTKELKFATSYSHDGDDGITQAANIDDLEIEWMVQLLDKNKLEETRPPKYEASGTAALNAPTETTV